ncbi:MAG: V-type ATP synthase subunit A [Proteobacteria bacterium]|nr:V-type ATP synthase subunit A [Pseudomonadota bacterium]
MKGNIGFVKAVNGNMVSVEFDCRVKQNEVAYVIVGELRLKSEVVRITNDHADLQVFDSTRGIMTGDEVEFTGELLSVELGPGLLGNVYDGLQNPLYEMSESYGYFLEKGVTLPALPKDVKWEFLPTVKEGERVEKGDCLGTVMEGLIKHRIMVPFKLSESYEVANIVVQGEYTISDIIATLRDDRGREFPLTMSFNWPVKRAINFYEERLAPEEPLITRIRIIDTLFPVSKGGTYCIPGPFGSGKTVLQQITSRNAMADIVIIAACGERAGEVVETIREFPEIIDPRTGNPLMERTIIICNTSSMPVAAREASVYTAVTLAEYYRQMGLDVLLLADSTSRWAQAMRERSGRLEEIPGEEAFPAYLETLISGFYERAGMVRLKDGSTGSVTIGGTISPAGGNFEEPVTQATLKVVGTFHALSRDRSDARRYPAIEPLESWSTYKGIIDAKHREWINKLLTKSYEIEQMMKVIGEEGTSLNDYITFLKGDLFDSVYLQQNAFDEVDAATPEDRQKFVFEMLFHILHGNFSLLKDKEEARHFAHHLRQCFLDLNSAQWGSEQFERITKNIQESVEKYMDKDSGLSRLLLRSSFVDTIIDSSARRLKKAKTILKEDIEAETDDETGI